jgi:hypothetical protein
MGWAYLGSDFGGCMHGMESLGVHIYTERSLFGKLDRLIA